VKGRQILIEPLPTGGHAAALMVDGRLQDLLVDPPDGDTVPRPEAIYRATAGRPMKGLGGLMVDLGGGRTGYLRGPRNAASGAALIVQVATWAEPGKAPPVSDRVLLKGRAAILTPGAPGHNVARALRDETRRAALAAQAETAMAGADPTLGLILRSAAAAIDDAEIADEIAALRATWESAMTTAGSSGPGLLSPAPGAENQGRRDWMTPGTELVEGPAALAEAGVWDEIERLRDPLVRLGAGAMLIEPTRALVAVDVNTGSDLSTAAGLKANLAAAADLPRQLRLRGLGGQIVVDFAPLPKAQRRQVESALAAALRADGVETTIAGWTPLGHLELQRKRARRPLDLPR
jgi:Ribonuclease G/E